MIRTILTANTQTVFFNIPSDYVGKELEVIVFAKNEGVQYVELKKKQTSFAAITLDTQNFKFDRNEANER